MPTWWCAQWACSPPPSGCRGGCGGRRTGAWRWARGLTGGWTWVRGFHRRMEVGGQVRMERSAWINGWGGAHPRPTRFLDRNATCDPCKGQLDGEYRTRTCGDTWTPGEEHMCVLLVAPSVQSAIPGCLCTGRLSRSVTHRYPSACHTVVFERPRPMPSLLRSR